MTKWPGNLTSGDCQKTQNFMFNVLALKSSIRWKCRTYVCTHTHTQATLRLETKSVHTYTVITLWQQSNNKKQWKRKNSFRFIYFSLSLSLIAVRKMVCTDFLFTRVFLLIVTHFYGPFNHKFIAIFGTLFFSFRIYLLIVVAIRMCLIQKSMMIKFAFFVKWIMYGKFIRWGET